MRLPLLVFLCLPGLLFADPVVLVDAIPTGGTFLGTSPLGMPFRDAESVDSATIGKGLSEAVSGFLQSAEKNGISYICLLSAPGDKPIEVFVSPANATLKLSRKNSAVIAAYYHGGTVSPTQFIYTRDKPDAKRPKVSIKFQKISVPAGVTTAGWVYFDLARVQSEVLKAGSNTVFLQVDGVGATSPVPIPGMKEPLMMYDGQTTFTAAWYMGAEAEAAHERQASAK